jgi:hypothetical protein
MDMCDSRDSRESVPLGQDCRACNRGQPLSNWICTRAKEIHQSHRIHIVRHPPTHRWTRASLTPDKSDGICTVIPPALPSACSIPSAI